MKRSTIILTILTGLLIVGGTTTSSSCTRRSSGNSSQPVSNEMASSSRSPIPLLPDANSDTASNPPLNDSSEVRDSQNEGEREAEKFWSQYAPTCSGVTYMKSGRDKFIELNGFYIEVEYDPVTQADQLNGIEKKGTTRIKTATHRLFYNAKWHEWLTEMPSGGAAFDARFEKRLGQWKFSGTGYFNDFAQTMNCSQVPNSTNAENPLLRFDGVYRAYGEDADPKDDTSYWFKFYQDGSVSSVANQNAGYKNSGTWWTVRKVWECLTSINQGESCRPEVSQGNYSIAGTNVEYELRGRRGVIKNKAAIEENLLTVRKKIVPNGTQPNLVFEFIEINNN